MKRILCILFVLILSACGDCKYRAMYEVARAYDQQQTARVVVYQPRAVPGLQHAEVQVYSEGEWKWFRDGEIQSGPEYEITGQYLYFEPEEFLLVIRKGSYGKK